ncbi:MAG: MarR family transcriptional regulator [Clostridia bacterium]|nr:MarR family transcriptional regulator [Clostridia bacterium]
MKLEESGYEQYLYEYIDAICNLLSPDLWQNILMDCSKNEILSLWMLFRKKEATMSQIAEYIKVPLNTATGIVARMEKRELLMRIRSVEDKRVVTVVLTEQGCKLIQGLIGEIAFYFGQLMNEFSPDEIKLLGNMFEKLREILSQKRVKTEPKKIRKIEIE